MAKGTGTLQRKEGRKSPADRYTMPRLNEMGIYKGKKNYSNYIQKPQPKASLKIP